MLTAIGWGLRGFGRFCFRLSNKVFAFADDPHIWLSDRLILWFNSSFAFGVVRGEKPAFVSVFIGPLEFMTITETIDLNGDWDLRDEGTDEDPL